MEIQREAENRKTAVEGRRAQGQQEQYPQAHQATRAQWCLGTSCCSKDCASVPLNVLSAFLISRQRKAQMWHIPPLTATFELKANKALSIKTIEYQIQYRQGTHSARD